jgi:hypothetical protein
MSFTLEELNTRSINPLYDACREKAKEDRGVPAWLSESAILSAAEECGFSDALPSGITNGVKGVAENEGLLLFSKTLYYLLKADSNIEERLKGLSFPVIPEGEDPLAWLICPFYAVLPCALDSLRELKKAGVDEALLCATYRGIGESLNASTVRTNNVPSLTFGYFAWLVLYVEKRLFRVGRLNFEIRHKTFVGARAYSNAAGEIAVLMDDGVALHRSGAVLGSAHATDEDGSFVSVFTESETEYVGNPVDPDSFLAKKERVSLKKDEWSPLFTPGDTLVSVHIPSGDGFDRESVEQSYDGCRALFKKLYPDIPFKAFMCVSWLLAPELRDVLKPGSNIISFQNKYFKFPTKSSGLGVFGFAFKKNVSSLDELDLDSLPQNTSLHRNVIALYKNGGAIHETGGFFTF